MLYTLSYVIFSTMDTVVIPSSQAEKHTGGKLHKVPWAVKKKNKALIRKGKILLILF